MSSLEKFEINASIPVIRMIDLAKAKSFYLDFLGYQVDWEHKFHETSPTYMQISKGQSVIHLDGHAGKDGSVSNVRVPVSGIESFFDYLKSRDSEKREFELARPRGTSLEIYIVDPFDNTITFWESNS